MERQGLTLGNLHHVTVQGGLEDHAIELQMIWVDYLPGTLCPLSLSFFFYFIFGDRVSL